MNAALNSNHFNSLKNRLLSLGFLNLFVVSVLGLMLRSYSFTSWPLNYAYLLHGHSHFAFGGWLMPMTVWMVWQHFPSVVSTITFLHWRNIIVGFLFSSYGMLFSFPFQGYGPVSIAFSTLSVVSGFYLAIVLLKATKKEKDKTAIKFLRWGLVYLVLSAIGPFATGPLVAMGYQGSPLYYNAIYFYLHFQYNGWFVFVICSVLYKLLEATGTTQGKKAFYFLNLGCVSTYFLSVLWNHPSPIFYWIGGAGVIMQLIGLFYLFNDFLFLKTREPFAKNILWLVMSAFIVKNLLQALSAFPFFADMAYHHRNLVIAYLHLVLLGFASLFVMAMVLNSEMIPLNSIFKKFVAVFISGFVITESLLILNGLEIFNDHVGMLLFAFSWLLVFGAFGMSWSVRLSQQSKTISIV